MAVFGDFFAPMDPKRAEIGFAPPDHLEFARPGRQLSLHSLRLSHRRNRRVRSGHLPADDRAGQRPIPTALGFFVPGHRLQPPRHHPRPTSTSSARSTAAPSTSSAPTSSAATSFRAASSARRFRSPSRWSSVRAHHHYRHAGRHRLGLSRWRGSMPWVQRFVDLVLAFPQLPLYLALTSLIPVTAPSQRCSSPSSSASWRCSAGPSWPRGALQDPGARPHRVCARRHRRRLVAIAASSCATSSPTSEPPHRRGNHRHPLGRAARELPRLPRLRREAAADLLGPDAAGYRHFLGDRLLSLDPLARGLRADRRVRFQRARRRPARRHRPY